MVHKVSFTLPTHLLLVLSNAAVLGGIGACSSSNPCAEGWARDTNGNCVRFEEDTDSDTDTDTSGSPDTSEPTFQACERPAELPEDPMTDLGFYDNIARSANMIELVEVVIDPDGDEKNQRSAETSEQ